jgi:hypothetical protein
MRAAKKADLPRATYFFADARSGEMEGHAGRAALWRVQPLLASLR